MSFFTILCPKTVLKLWFFPKNQVFSNHRYGGNTKSRFKVLYCKFIWIFLGKILENRIFSMKKETSFTFDQSISRKCHFKFSQTIPDIIYWIFSENVEKTPNRSIAKISRFYPKRPTTMKSVLYPEWVVLRLDWDPNRTYQSHPILRS